MRKEKLDIGGFSSQGLLNRLWEHWSVVPKPAMPLGITREASKTAGSFKNYECLGPTLRFWFMWYGAWPGLQNLLNILRWFWCIDKLENHWHRERIHLSRCKHGPQGLPLYSRGCSQGVTRENSPHIRLSLLLFFLPSAGSDTNCQETICHIIQDQEPDFRLWPSLCQPHTTSLSLHLASVFTAFL